MQFMNEDEIDIAVRRYRGHPVLAIATRFLRAFKDEVNGHSDGWSYWVPPVRAARMLIELIRRGTGTEADLRRALAPIKAFYTRRGTAAGMVMPADGRGIPHLRRHRHAAGAGVGHRG
jgi:hypothetical protein